MSHLGPATPSTMHGSETSVSLALHLRAHATRRHAMVEMPSTHAMECRAADEQAAMHACMCKARAGGGAWLHAWLHACKEQPASEQGDVHVT
eukprot:358052-Chlamydomonas_euryale.AAC.4